MRVDREQLIQVYGPLFTTVAEILFRHDPIEINFGDNRDEYEPEVCTILPRLATATSAADVAVIVHEEYIAWFDADSAGPHEKYVALATDLGTAWQKWNGGATSGEHASDERRT